MSKSQILILFIAGMGISLFGVHATMITSPHNVANVKAVSTTKETVTTQTVVPTKLQVTKVPTNSPTVPITTSSTKITTIVPTTTKKVPIETTVVTTPKPSITIVISQSVGSASRGQYVTEGISTAVGAYCTIEVDYKSGPSKADGLTPQTTNGTGSLSWTWKVGTNTTPGQWPIYIECSINGASKQVADSFVVQ